MTELLTKLFSSDFMPHGYCYLWNPGILWLHALSDGFIALAYYLIPITLVYFVRKRRDLPFHWMFLMFGVFILGCGTTHAMEIWTLWHGAYWLAGVVKALTAGASVATAALLVPLVPRALNLPSPAQLQDANAALRAEIAERNRAEQALRASEERFRRYFDLGLIGMAITSPDRHIIEINDKMCEILGYERDELFQKSWPELTHPDDLAADLAQFNRVLGREIDGYSLDKRFIRKDGAVVHTTISVKCLRREDGSVDHFVALIQDITDRKRFEDALRATSEQMRALSASVQSATERERTRIAREVHDELGSALTSLKWGIEALDKSLSGSPAQGQSATLREKTGAMIRLAETTINEVRRIASELRPSILDDLGLVDAIEWQAQQFQAQTGITCNCDCSADDVPLSREQYTGLFRIFQEAFTNVLRHAQATNVDINTRQEASEFVLTIHDNGRGVTEAEKSGPLALGLLGMRERAHLIGARIEIVGIEGRGTTVTVCVPVLNGETHSHH